MFKIPVLSPIGEESFLGKSLIKSRKFIFKIRKNRHFGHNFSETIKKLSQVDNSEDDIHYFLHIPKTAGTSLLTILDDKFDYNQICNRHDWGELLEDFPKNFSKAKFFRGHYGYGFYRVFSKKPRYLTMLRDPIKQIPSLYKQSRRNFRLRFGKEPPSDSLLNYISHPQRRLVPKDNQTRHIAIDLDTVYLIKKMDEKSFGEFYRFNSPEFKLPKLNDNKLLDQAKRNLSKFVFFGITEKFEKSIQLLSYTFGWNPIKDAPHLNINPNKTNEAKELPKETLDAINDCTKLDRELYEFASKLFDERYENMINCLKSKYYDESLSYLKNNDLVYELLERHYKEVYLKSKPQITSIHYDFTLPLMGSGWHRREKIHLTKKLFRWTGPKTVSTIDLPLKIVDDVSLKFQIIMSMAPDILESLKVKANDVPIEVSGKTIFSGTISKPILEKNKNFTRLSFHVNRTINPKSLNPQSEDIRELGLAFEWIKIV